jgi:nicotinate-nucleotide pyrophosphorylase (carboxylating)
VTQPSPSFEFSCSGIVHETLASARKSERMEHVLMPWELERMAKEWLKYDVPKLDIGGFVVGCDHKTAKLLGKSTGIFCGRPFAQAVFNVVGDLQVEWLIQDGEEITSPSALEKRPIALVQGPAHKILLAERTVLNILARASGVATLTRKFVSKCRLQGYQGHVAGTRKTTPGDFALVEKYALLVGGGSTHRMDLSQMTMLKDNHIWSKGSITLAVKEAKKLTGFSTKVEVEVQSLEEAMEACIAGADVVMLDNMTPLQVKQNSTQIKLKFPHVLLEASGGILEESILDYVCSTIDVISVGKLTQGYPTLDFSLKIDKVGREKSKL